MQHGKKISSKLDPERMRRYWAEESALLKQLDDAHEERKQADGTVIRVQIASKHSDIWERLNKLRQESQQYFESCLEP